MTLRFLCIFFLFASLIAPHAVMANVVDRNVAIVNDDTITLSEVNEFGKPYFQKVVEQTPREHLEQALQQAKMAVLGKLIDRRLMLQEAKKLGIQVTDQEVDSARQRVMETNKVNREQFLKELGEMGTTEAQYREELRDQILSSKLINHEVRTRVVIPEDKIRSYYETHYVEDVEGGNYSILQIGVSWDTPLAGGAILSQNEARANAEEIRKLAAKGEDFKELAKKYSDLPSAVDGGDLGSFERDEMAPHIREAVLHLKSGEISQVVEFGKSYQIFKLDAKQTGQQEVKASYESVKEKIREQLGQEAMEQRFKDWMQSIRDKAYIKIL